MDFSTLCELFTWLKGIMSGLLGSITITVNTSITINSGNNSNNKTVVMASMNDKRDIKEVWLDIETDIPVVMPNGKDIAYLHASKTEKQYDNIHFGRYFCVPAHALPDHEPLRFWVGVIHYEKPEPLDGNYIWVCKKDGRDAPKICGVACKGNDYHIPIPPTGQGEQVIQQMLDDIFRSIA